MTRRNRFDFASLAGATLLTLAIALSVGWWYGLDWNAAMRFAPQYFGMFALAVGIPAYYLLRQVSPQRSGAR